MKTLVVAQQKGGVGKTASVVHLAFDFLERGLRVLVIDLDTQGNASWTLQGYASGLNSSQLFRAPDEAGALDADGLIVDDAPNITLIASDPGLADIEKRPIEENRLAFRSHLEALARRGFDVALIDTAPAIGSALSAALYAAGFVLSPIELEVYSILGIDMMRTTIENVQEQNPALQFLGMLPCKVDSRNPRHRENLNYLRAQHPDALIDGTIGLRSSIADALAMGKPVWHIKKTAARKASQEVRWFARFVYDSLHLEIRQ